MIRVLIVDDSAMMREVLIRILSSDPEIEVVGAAPDPVAALELIRSHNPDVLTLDIEMPRLDGLSFLDRLMKLRPMPVVMISALTQEGADTTLQALEMGAVDFICKPKLGHKHDWLSLRDEVIAKVKAATSAIIRPGHSRTARPKPKKPAGRRATASGEIVAIGASTGGVGALLEVLEQLPAEVPPILVVQHMPAAFVRQFARRLDSRCAVTVQEAMNGEKVRPGHVYIAPGDRHLLLELVGGNLQCQLEVGDKVNGHMPSVDKLFNSVAAIAGRRSIGLLLTGMGRDGATGLGRMRRVGAVTACQDEDSSVVYGMPKAAMSIGAAEHQLPLSGIASFILEHCCIDRAAAPDTVLPSPAMSARVEHGDKLRPARRAVSGVSGGAPAVGKSHPAVGILTDVSNTVWVAPADYYVTCSATEVLTTILGSCIAVCIRDPVIGCGGMNHFVLPKVPEPSNGLPSIELRYGSYSIERLINAVLTRGGERDRLEIKIFGGSNVLGTSNVGYHNADFVEAYLEKEGLPVAAKDLRGKAPRRIHYRPSTGQVLMSQPRDPTAALKIDEELQGGIRRILATGVEDAEIFPTTVRSVVGRPGS